jgi:phosphohistidine swiveling domain-containing protein
MSATTFSTKARTLENLAPLVTCGRVLPQLRFNAAEWDGAARQLQRVGKTMPSWLKGEVIVRSSAAIEDSANASLAGHFISVAGVTGDENITKAVDRVFGSFSPGSPADEVFIQPMLTNVVVSGVAFTRDPSNGSHYYVINYDDQTGSTNTVTSGSTNNLRTVYAAKAGLTDGMAPWIRCLIRLLEELETILGHDALDVEFAVEGEGQVCLLQVRPLVLRVQGKFSVDEHGGILRAVRQRVAELSLPHPYLRGNRAVFGIMPDWNPAEIVGVRPRPLALSLYKDLVTDSTWAYQRENYGYRTLRSFPLLVNFGGCPYIDVRVSFNSFIPQDTSEDLAHRLVEHYIQRLIDTPSHHDKVEFEIIYSCYTFDLPERLQALRDHGFSPEDCTALSQSLRRLTNKIIHGEQGIWRGDVRKIEELKRRQQAVSDSSLPPLGKIYWLLEDCKRYGTLPFAGLARAGFIAVQVLRSLVSVSVLTQQDFDNFMNSLDTVSSGLCKDLAELPRQDFLAKYGHLRPGTYNILSARYDEAPDRYFRWDSLPEPASHERQPFAFGLPVLNRMAGLLKEHGIEHDVLSLFNFLKAAIEGREYSKFVFTRSLSDALQLFEKFGREHGFDTDDLSFADIGIVRRLYSSSASPQELLRESIAEGRRNYEVTQALSLPPLVTTPDDVFRFELPASEPNFITQKSVTGMVVGEHERSNLAGNIMLIPSADPGYDWIFSHKIGGFVTMYGGMNSHMAIRAGELAMPAVIGAGEALYKLWSNARSLELDCANRQVHVIS